MRECMIGMYRIQEENVVTKGGGKYQVNCEGFGTVQVQTNFRRGGRDPIVCYKYNQPGLLAWISRILAQHALIFMC
jgi:hypothetical protein